MADATLPRDGRGCLDPGILAAYVDGTLSRVERAEASTHLAQCDLCVEVVAELMHAQEVRVGSGQESPAPAGPRFFARRARPSAPLTRFVLPVGGALAAAAALVLVIRTPSVPVARHAAPAQLVEAVGASRAVEGRLTGGFSYGPLRTPDRSTDASKNFSLLAAAGELQKAAAVNPTTGNLHAWGVAQLTVGEYAGGVATLEAAALHADASPHVCADLAAGRLALATSGDRPEELPRALQASEEALKLAPDLPEAWFTKAIVLERLRMPDQAREAWRQYLRLDPASEWGREARDRLASLSEPTSAAKWPDLERELVEGAHWAEVSREQVDPYAADLREALVTRLLAGWAGAADATQAEAQLARAEHAARLLEAGGRDRFFTEALLDIREAAADRRALIAAGVRALGEGLRAQAAERPPAEIRPALERAVTLLERCESSLSLWGDLALARFDALASRHDEVARRAARVARRAAAIGARAVEARAHWMGGMTAFQTGRWSAAHDAYARALDLCTGTGETALAGAVHLNASVLNRFLGNAADTWRHREAAATRLPAHRPLQVHTFLTTGAMTAAVELLPDAALVFQHEVIANAQNGLPVGARAEAHMARARMLARIDRHADAERDLGAAEQLVADVSSPAMRDRLRRAALLASADVRRRTDPRRAARDAGDAVAAISAAGEPMRLAEAHLLEARALGAAGNLAAATSAAGRGMDAFERALASVDPTNPIRISALEPVWALYSEAARLHLASPTNQYASAFEVTERGRARTLVDLRRALPLRLHEAQQKLQDHEALLLIDQSATDLVAWWITRGTVRVSRANVGARAVERLIDRQRRGIDAGERRTQPSSALFDLAVRPWWSELRKVTAVAIIPDGPWHGAAWPALWDTQSGTELVEAVALVVSPSAAVALGGRAALPALRSALVVSAASVPGTRELPAARLEAREIARLYPAARLLEAEAATPEALLHALASADVVHVSSHATDVPAYPHLSHLVLASSGSGSKLFVRDIAAAHLPRTRLVVLAACATAGHRRVRGEGSVGVAWGFLTAGVKHVVATLHDIEDGPAQALFTRFHRRLAAGEAPSTALRQVQRELAASGESPRVWATVAVLGAL